MIIAKTAFQEKIRRKELYIVSAIGVLILLLFSTGPGTLSINGTAVTDYRVLAPILLTVTNAIGCILAVAMSLGTIPNEYERCTSHLIWIRKVPQWRYHGELALANVTAGLVSEAILFVPLLILMRANRRAGQLWKLFPAYLILGINIAAVSMLASMLSVALPRFAAGAVSGTIALAGIFHSILETLKDMAGGLGGELIRHVLKLIPSLHGIQAQAGNVLYGGKPDFHVILTGLLAAYMYTVLLFLFQRGSSPSDGVHIRKGIKRILAGFKEGKRAQQAKKGITMKKLAIPLTGAVLAAGTIATGSYGPSGEDLAIYEAAVAMEDRAPDIGFDNFFLTDYPVAVYDGDRDYVLTRETDGYRVKKRKALYRAVVATAWPVDGHYEVLVPSVDKLASVLELVSMGTAEYGREEYIATLWHEAFHCYQLTYFADKVEALYPPQSDEGIIVAEADSRQTAVSLFKQQARLLEEAAKADDVDIIRECIVKYKKLDEERKELLPENVTALEDYYIAIEGTACYVEARIYQMLAPERFEEGYMDLVSEYVDGSAKYYRIGMAQCMILDKLDPGWKRGFDFSEPVMRLVYDRLGI